MTRPTEQCGFIYLSIYLKTQIEGVKIGSVNRRTEGANKFG
jgi:hypothetical protein